MSMEPCSSERVFTRAYPFWHLCLSNSLFSKVTWKMEGERNALERKKSLQALLRFSWGLWRESPCTVSCIARHFCGFLSEARDTLMKCVQWAQANTRDAKGWTGCTESSVNSCGAHATTLSALSLLTALCSVSCSSLSPLGKTFCDWLNSFTNPLFKLQISLFKRSKK